MTKFLNLTVFTGYRLMITVPWLVSHCDILLMTFLPMWRFSWCHQPTERTVLIKVTVRVTLRQAVYRQSARLGVKPFETHDQRSLLFQLSPCGNSPYVTSSLTRIWICLLWTWLALRQAQWKNCSISCREPNREHWKIRNLLRIFISMYGSHGYSMCKYCFSGTIFLFTRIHF
jgi:hypothetical protein